MAHQVTGLNGQAKPLAPVTCSSRIAFRNPQNGDQPSATYVFTNGSAVSSNVGNALIDADAHAPEPCFQGEDAFDYDIIGRQEKHVSVTVSVR